MAVGEINAEDWAAKVQEAEGVVAVEFWHDKCVWCKKFAPLLEEASEKFPKAKFYKMNILAKTENQELAASKGIMSTPTTKFFCHGMPIGEIIGLKDAEALAADIERVEKEAERCIGQSTRIE